MEVSNPLKHISSILMLIVLSLFFGYILTFHERPKVIAADYHMSSIKVSLIPHLANTSLVRPVLLICDICGICGMAASGMTSPGDDL